jgi:hypothetical protein
MQAAVVEAEKVLKKQRTCGAKVDQSLQELIDLAQGAKAALQGDPSLPADQVLASIKLKLEDKGTSALQNAVAQTKELHSAIGKLGKVGCCPKACCCPCHVRRAHAMR